MSTRIITYLAGFLLTAYVFLLLGTTYLARQNALTSAAKDLVFNLEKRVAAVNYYCSERENDINYLSDHKNIYIYFVNKALGMSVEYGLLASSMAMEKSFNDLVSSKRINNFPVYSRLLFIDSEGDVLVDVGSASNSPLPVAKNILLQVGDRKMILEGHGDEVSATHFIPYYFKGIKVGIILVRENRQALTRQLIHPQESDMIHYVWLLDDNPDLMLPSGKDIDGTWGEAVPGYPLESNQHYAAYLKRKIRGTPFLLAAAYRNTAPGGLLTSKYYFLSLVGLAVLLLVIMLVTVRIQARALIATVKQQEEEKQRHLLEREVVIRRKAEQVAIELARHDPLTGLYNRRELDERTDWEIGRATRYNRELSMFLLDLDHFKLVNDKRGHSCGDLVLQYFADILTKFMRNSDCVARYGGEEFVVLLPETSLATAEKLAEKLCRHIAGSLILTDGDNPVHITASIGVSSFPIHGLSRQELFEQADRAMYRAKEAGRNRVMVAQSD